MARSSQNRAQKHNAKSNAALRKLDMFVGKWGSIEQFTMLYADARGVSRVLQMSLNNFDLSYTKIR